MGVSLQPLDQIHLRHMVREKNNRLCERAPSTRHFWTHFGSVAARVQREWEFAHTYIAFQVRQIISLRRSALLTSPFQHEASYRTLIDIVLTGMRRMSDGLDNTTLQLTHEFTLASAQRPIGIYTRTAVFYLLGIADYFMVTAGANREDHIRGTTLQLPHLTFKVYSISPLQNHSLRRILGVCLLRATQ